MSQKLIEVQNVTKIFSAEQRRGIFNISFSVGSGEIVCILGPSGAGKSTLLRLMAGLEKSDGGKISTSIGGNHFGNVIYVPQDYTLWPHLTILENLTIAPKKVKRLNAQAVTQKALAALQRFNLASYASAYPHELSGGQKQRVALLRAIIMEPQILLLDEVTSALDPELTKSVLDIVRTLAKDGYTMLIVTHHVSLALAIADRIIFMDAGMVQQDLPARQFFFEQMDKKILSFISEIAKYDRNIEVFEGVEQFQAYHLNLLKRLPEHSTIYVAGSIGDRWYLPMGNMYSAYEKIRLQKKIKWKMVMYEFGAKDKKLAAQYPHLNEFHALPRTLQNQANYNVMENDTVIIQIFGDRPTIIEIKDAAVAESYLKFFEEMWNISLPMHV